MATTSPLRLTRRFEKLARSARPHRRHHQHARDVAPVAGARHGGRGVSRAPGIQRRRRRTPHAGGDCAPRERARVGSRAPCARAPRAVLRVASAVRPDSRRAPARRRSRGRACTSANPRRRSSSSNTARDPGAKASSGWGSGTPRGCVRESGPVEYLDRMGFLDDRVLVVHGVHLAAAELKRLVAIGVTLVTCPRGNMRTGAGEPPIEDVFRCGHACRGRHRQSGQRARSESLFRARRR